MNKLVKHIKLKKDTKISHQNSSPPNSYLQGFLVEFTGKYKRTLTLMTRLSPTKIFLVFSLFTLFIALFLLVVLIRIISQDHKNIYFSLAQLTFQLFSPPYGYKISYLLLILLISQNLRCTIKLFDQKVLGFNDPKIVMNNPRHEQSPQGAPSDQQLKLS